MTNKLDQRGAEILRYKYDPDSRLTNRWSTAKGDTAFSYDAVANLTFINYPVSPDVTFGGGTTSPASFGGWSSAFAFYLTM